MQTIKQTRGVFKPPQKQYYLGRVRHGTPYFYPLRYHPTIFSIRKLKKRTQEETDKKNKSHNHNLNSPNHLYLNYPMVRRTKNKIVKLFGNHYYISVGWPVNIHSVELGWKTKYDSVRFEWPPAFYIHFFLWQFCIWWNAPKINNEKHPDNDKYYEMMLWYLHYADKDIQKAEETWGWVDGITGKSTWEKKYLV